MNFRIVIQHLRKLTFCEANASDNFGLIPKLRMHRIALVVSFKHWMYEKYLINTKSFSGNVFLSLRLRVCVYYFTIYNENIITVTIIRYSVQHIPVDIMVQNMTNKGFVIRMNNDQTDFIFYWLDLIMVKHYK